MSNDLLVIDKEQKQLLKDTVCRGATDAELSMFIEICKATKLNPFKKEIWFIKTNGTVQMMTGINGFFTIANNSPAYDGMEVSIDEKDGRLISATAKVYRKDRRFPSVGTAYYQEYAKGSPVWRQMPRVMLTKVAKSIALREAFSQELNGLYTEEEMPIEYACPKEEPKKSLAEKIEVTIEEPKKEQPETKEAITHTYDLKKLPQASQGKAIAWANAHELEVVYTDESILIQSDTAISKFKNCEVKEEQEQLTLGADEDGESN